MADDLLERQHAVLSSRARRVLRFAVTGGLVALVAILVLVSSVGFGYRAALQLETDLTARFAGPDTFVPDSTIRPDRMRRFLAVRHDLRSKCRAVADVQRTFADVRAHGDAAAAGNRIDLLTDIVRAGRLAPAVGYRLGQYVTARDRSLLTHEMGLGEYTWLYAVVYFVWLDVEPVGVIDATSSATLDRVRAQVAAMIRRYPTAAEPPLDRPFDWQLPPALQTSLMENRPALLETVCPGAAEVDLTQTVPRGAWFDHR